MRRFGVYVLPRLASFFLVTTGVAVLSACGGGAGGPQVATTPVTGYASKGPLAGARCNLYNQSNQLVATATTSQTGSIDWGRTSQAGGLYAQCQGGTYLDEATGQTVANVASLTGAVASTDGRLTNIVITPLTELAWNLSEGDPSKLGTSAKRVAAAFGLDGVDITSVVPTDLSTRAAAGDASGKYGVILAAIAQMQKDQNTSLPTLMDQLGSAVSVTNTGTGQLNAATSNLLQQALVNLTDSRFNGNEAVRSNARETAASVESLKSGADATPFAHSIVLQDASQATVTLPVWGRTYTLSVTGGNLAGASLETSAMVCNAPAVNPTNTLLVATCTIDTAGGQASVAVRVNGQVVHGKAPSASYYLGDGKASCQGGGAVVGSVTPTSLVYATQDQLITVRGCNLGVDALATLDGTTASPQAGATATQLQYRFDVSNRRLAENRGSLQIGAAPYTVQVLYSAPPVAVASVTPPSYHQGAKGSASMQVDGSGLYSGMAVRLNGTLCVGGVANATATQLLGVDCSGVTLGANDTKATLAVDGVAWTGGIPLTVPPAADIQISANQTTFQAGGSIQLQVRSNNLVSPITWTSSNSDVTVDSVGRVGGTKAGASATITASQSALAGQYRASAASVVVAVSAQSVPSLAFEKPSTVLTTLGYPDTVNPAQAACAAITTAYQPTVRYSIASDSTVNAGNTKPATVDRFGKVVVHGAGSVAVTARVDAVVDGAQVCAAQTGSYVLVVDKARPLLAFDVSTLDTQYGALPVTRTAVVQAPAAMGSGTLPSTSGLVLGYESSNPSVVAVGASGRVSILGVGTAQITARTSADANYLATVGDTVSGGSYRITVAKAVPVLQMAGTLLLDLGNDAQGKANPATLTGAPGADVPTGAIVYTSANSAVATVDAYGTVVPVAPGTTIIVAQYAGDARYAAAPNARTDVTVEAFSAGQLNSSTQAQPDTAVDQQITTLTVVDRLWVWLTKLYKTVKSVVLSFVFDAAPATEPIPSQTASAQASSSAPVSQTFVTPGTYTVNVDYRGTDGSVGRSSHQLQVTCMPGAWVSPPNSQWDEFNGAFPVKAESQHFQLRWPADKPNLISAQQAKDALDAMEGVWNWFINAVGWVEPFCDSPVKYKAQIFAHPEYGLNGAGGGERTPAMWVNSGEIAAAAVGQVGGMVHEFTHSMQFASMGMRNTLLGGWLWESHAEFMASQYPGNADKVGCSFVLAWQPHLYYGSTRNRYCNWQFWDHLKNKYGFRAVSNMFIKTPNMYGQDPFEVLMRSQNWTPAQLGDEFGEFAMKNVNWDYIDPDGFNRGAEYRRVFGNNNDVSNGDHAQRLRQARLDPVNLGLRQFAVSSYFAPQRYGYNLVRLFPDPGATSIGVNFRGVVQSAKVADAEYGTLQFEPGTAGDWAAMTVLQDPASNWRWGVVALDASGKARRSALQSGARGALTFGLQAQDTEVYLVVVAAPDVHHRIFWDQKYHTIYRFPWKVQLSGAMPNGYQAGYTNGFPAGHPHPNGGGWVADGATVAATAYVGPNAAVLGGVVEGQARIEDYAIVWNGLVKDQAVVGGLTQLDTNLTVSGNASVRAVMAGGQSFDWGTVLTGTVKLYGDIETHLGSSTFSAGAFTGFLVTEWMTDASHGAALGRLPTEVTAPIPAGWID